MKLFKKKNKVQSKPKIQKTLTTPTTAVVKKREQEPEKLNYEVLSIPISYIDHRYQQHNHHQTYNSSSPNYNYYNENSYYNFIKQHLSMITLE